MSATVAAETEIEAIMHRRVDEWIADKLRRSDLARAQVRRSSYTKMVRSARHTRMLTRDTARLRLALRHPDRAMPGLTRYLPWATCSPLNVAGGGLV